VDILHITRSLRRNINRRRATSGSWHRERPRRRCTHLVATVPALRLLPLCRRQIAPLSDRHRKPQRLEQLAAALDRLSAHPQCGRDRLMSRGHAPARRLIRGRTIRIRDTQERVRCDLRRPPRLLTLRRAQRVHHGVEPRGRARPCRQRPIRALGRRQHPAAQTLTWATCSRCRRHGLTRHAGRAGRTYSAICADSGYYEATSYRTLVGTTKLRLPAGSSSHRLHLFLSPNFDR